MEKSLNKANILGCFIDMVDNGQAISKIIDFINRGNPSQIITLNAEIVYAALEDERLKMVINNADLVTPDGIGIVWAARRLGYNLKERVTGIDMLYNVCGEAQKNGWKIYLLGAAPQIAEKAAENLIKIYPKLEIIGCKDGYFNENEIDKVCQEIRDAKPDILFVALGAPKQEFFISDYKDILGVPVCIGVGGSFDVVAGTKKRAPEIMIKLNLEWLYRLLTEPSRIKRQMALPKFVVAVLTQGKKA